MVAVWQRNTKSHSAIRQNIDPMKQKYVTYEIDKRNQQQRFLYKKIDADAFVSLPCCTFF